jgi:predicted AAA+ superfamily ATPase
MKRTLYKELLLWKDNPHRKPLVLRGARQVGKTHLLESFGKSEFQQTAYINFEEDPEAGELFEGRLDPTGIVRSLSLYLNMEIEASHTLIILDEIQHCQKAITALKYFCEQAPEYTVAAAGSHLGIRMREGASFPVGKVDFLMLYPMSFPEFLNACGKERLVDFLTGLVRTESIPGPIHTELMDLVKTYLFVGGMPEVVNTYIETSNFEKVRRAQKGLLIAFAADFSKYATASDIPKIHSIWDSVPNQLAKANKKFMYAKIRAGARSREYESGMSWLLGCGLLHRVPHLTNPRRPLCHYWDGGFKIYFFDVGLLAAKAGIPAESLLGKDRMLVEFNGALAENFVLQELISHGLEDVGYWTSPGNAEVDFVVDNGHEILPLEVKAGENPKSKSLKVYAEKYKPDLITRSTGLNLKLNGDILNLPLYMISQYRRMTTRLVNET